MSLPTEFVLKIKNIIYDSCTNFAKFERQKGISEDKTTVKLLHETQYLMLALYTTSQA